MVVTNVEKAASSLFRLKERNADLTERASARVSNVTVAALEELRVFAARIPASRHGLECITGASCETGAQ